MAKEFRVSRSTTIAAPPERILPLITTLREWRKWSPWEGLDPNLERKYAGRTPAPGGPTRGGATARRVKAGWRSSTWARIASASTWSSLPR